MQSEHPMPECEGGGFCAGVNSKFVENIAEVSFYSPFTDE